MVGRTVGTAICKLRWLRSFPWKGSSEVEGRVSRWSVVPIVDVLVEC